MLQAGDTEMNEHKYSIYGCQQCGLFITKDPNFPNYQRCVCAAVHGQYLQIEVRNAAGERSSVGPVLITSGIIKRMAEEP
jgi:hypothetical protein